MALRGPPWRLHTSGCGTLWSGGAALTSLGRFKLESLHLPAYDCRQSPIHGPQFPHLKSKTAWRRCSVPGDLNVFHAEGFWLWLSSPLIRVCSQLSFTLSEVGLEVRGPPKLTDGFCVHEFMGLHLNSPCLALSTKLAQATRLYRLRGDS